MQNIFRIFVEKKNGFDVEAKSLHEEIMESLRIGDIKRLRVLNRYDVAGIDYETYKEAVNTVFSEPATDKVFEGNISDSAGFFIFGVEYLPGQYDQRADSAVQCIKLINPEVNPLVKCAKIILIEGDLTRLEKEQIIKYSINPVDSMESILEMPESLEQEMLSPADVEVINGFLDMPEGDIKKYKEEMGFAMSEEDLLFVKKYFKEEEKRNPTITELRVIDTYWSDHCRHTTFLSKINNIEFENDGYSQIVKKAYEEYLDIRKDLYKDKQKDISLMDIACIGAKYLKVNGHINDLDESDEINACSIKVNANIDGKEEDWVVMFKNETHNHPTEIEPFGGAATCLGGAIRDPLSGRVYVYQAMRITGSGDPRTPFDKTLDGKLPQIKITKGAAAGYSSYGNQIGLATGKVEEIYHEGYVAKRMEVGAVIGAAPFENIRREKPILGDEIILVGGRTGRDGCGGATGSSKEHTADSILTCGAEVQKGNPPVERNIQRLFRRKEVTSLIKKCNDFGAGGVSVAIGELADSLDVNLDLVLKKYDGLDGTELAISESQERMAVVVEKKDVDKFLEFAKEENLEGVAVAKITDTGRFRMFWQGQRILDLSREFLDTNGVKQEINVKVCKEKYVKEKQIKSFEKEYENIISDLNCASQKGLLERFDSTIGANTVLMPLGGNYQLSPTLGMVAKLPVTKGITSTATLMTYGFDPHLSENSPFHGALYAVIDSVTKIVAMGGKYQNVRLTFQEYFEKMTDEKSWGKPFSALLGALKAQKELQIPAIGGKDSMSGTFKEINVPPTLISFAVSTCDVKDVISTEFKSDKSKIVFLGIDIDVDGVIDFEKYKKNMDKVSEQIQEGRILAASTVGKGGIFASIVKMAAGNHIGVKLKALSEEELMNPSYGALLLEMAENTDFNSTFCDVKIKIIGETTKENAISISYNDDFGKPKSIEIDLIEIIEKWAKPLSEIFPERTTAQNTEVVKRVTYFTNSRKSKANGPLKVAKPRIIIPVFPGTNCEIDSKLAFEKAGGEVNLHILRNLTSTELLESLLALEKKIRNSQIIMIPGGFSGGDEPDGSAKFIIAVFRNPRIKDAITDLLENRDGLILGICNGFQALIKLGLVPYGKIIDMDENSPTLTYNKIGRHMSCLVRTRISSNLSPWLMENNIGDFHLIPVSHGEGRFVANEKILNELSEKGQVATQYVGLDGLPSMETFVNPNGSDKAIEGITSPDGRVLGKMAHSERIGKDLYKNVPGEQDQKIFYSGIKYFL